MTTHSGPTGDVTTVDASELGSVQDRGMLEWSRQRPDDGFVIGVALRLRGTRPTPERLAALVQARLPRLPVLAEQLDGPVRQECWRAADGFDAAHHVEEHLDGPGGVEPAFQRGAADLVRSPWLVSTSTDRAWQDTDLPLSSRIATGFLGAVTARLPHHPGLYLRFVRTMQMLDPPATLASPRALTQLASVPSVKRHLASCTCPGAVT
ncbi:hypothetical protein KV557_23045 [Kitasatospora aureofaciens]|uniref:hypothetical protein n=1 Tax=Kitasatospora aureofaciens TaxID=1894 RepID=UPI001C4649DC|nr:hypothetical protein [Kitasatospora aureofaciens]MBV6699943.1 hypothetical protein [Kitasatospora aureofaciens]